MQHFGLRKLALFVRNWLLFLLKPQQPIDLKKKDNKCLPWRLAESKSSPSQVAIWSRKRKKKKNLACQKKLEVRIKVFFSSTYFAISDNWSFPSLLESKTCNIVSVYWISSSSDTSWLFLASRSKSRRKFWNSNERIQVTKKQNKTRVSWTLGGPAHLLPFSYEISLPDVAYHNKETAFNFSNFICYFWHFYLLWVHQLQ